MTEPNGSNASHQIITFYIPVLRANRMPETAIWFELEEPLPWLHHKVRNWAKKLPEEATEAGKNMVFCRWGHTLEEMPPVDLAPLDAALQMMEVDHPGTIQSEAGLLDLAEFPPVANRLFRAHSILIASTPLLEGSRDVAISNAFDTCIERVRHFEQAYVIVEGDLEFIPQSLSTTYPFAPFTVFDLDQMAVVEKSLFHVNLRPGVFNRVEPEPMEWQDFENVKMRSSRIHMQEPWSTNTVLHFAARRSLELLGDRVSCVIQGYIAGESLIDALTLSLSWERQGETINGIDLTRESVLGYFSWPRTPKWRSDNLLTDLLKGWYPGDKRKPLFDWFDKYAKLRNRTAHLGEEPTELDCAELLENLEALQVYVSDVLAHDRNRFRFPKSALLYLGKPGLERRELFSKRMQQIIDNGSDEFWAGEIAEFSSGIVKSVWG